MSIIIKSLCVDCGNEDHFQTITNEIYYHEGIPHLIENITVLECTQCKTIQYPHNSMVYMEQRQNGIKNNHITAE